MSELTGWRDKSWHVQFEEEDGRGGHGPVMAAPDILHDLDSLIAAHAEQGRTIHCLWCLQTSIYFLEDGFQVVVDCDELEGTFPTLLAAFEGLERHYQERAKSGTSDRA